MRIQSSNPVFNRDEAFTKGGYASFGTGPAGAGTATATQAGTSAATLEEMYRQPPATPLRAGTMSYDDVITKTGISFALLLIGAGLGWVVVPQLYFVFMLVGLGLGLVNSFKREPSAPLILGYAFVEGLAIGGLSSFFEAQWPGIVSQAVLATLVVFAVTLGVYKSGKVRVTPKFRKIAMIAIISYLAFSVVNLFVMIFGGGDAAWGLRGGWLGVAVGIFAVVLGAVFLVLDFDFVEQGVKNGLPEKYGWTAAFGLTVTLVWIYLEILRLLAILRGDN